MAAKVPPIKLESPGPATTVVTPDSLATLIPSSVGFMASIALIVAI